jgi:hypothetical protein
MFLPKYSPPVERKDYYFQQKPTDNKSCEKYVIDFNNVDSIGKGLQPECKCKCKNSGENRKCQN